MSEKYQVINHGMNGRYGVINTTIPDEEERVIVTCDSEVRARLVVDELNNLQHQIDEKPLNLHDDFKKWYELIERINKNSRRLVEIDEEYKEKSEKILAEARKIKEETDVDVIKDKFGGNNDKTRKTYVKEELSDLIEEKRNLTINKEEDNRKIPYLKRLIDMKIELMKINNKGE